MSDPQQDAKETETAFAELLTKLRAAEIPPEDLAGTAPEVLEAIMEGLIAVANEMVRQKNNAVVAWARQATANARKRPKEIAG